MKYFILFTLLFNIHFVYSQADCKNFTDEYIPKNLTDALNYLNCIWSDESKDEFRNKNEDDAVAELHMWTGQAIRNNWDLWAKKRNSLVKYFNSLGIYHPDDMSSIILTSFHRQLNGIDIDLKGQVEVYVKNWNEIKEKEKEIKKLFKTLAIGDTIKIPYDTATFFKGKISFFPVLAYTDRTDINSYDCVVTGVLEHKKMTAREYLLTVRAIDMCGYEMVITGDTESIAIGETFEHDMKFCKILFNRTTRKRASKENP